jgi:hypothetical protein
LVFLITPCRVAIILVMPESQASIEKQSVVEYGYDTE